MIKKVVYDVTPSLPSVNPVENPAESVAASSAAPSALALWVRDFLARFAPQPGLTITMLIGVAILLSLGTWQVLRLQEKNAILRDIRAQLAAPAHDLRRDLPRNDAAWRDLEHKPVTLHGVWLSLQRLKLAPRTFDEQVGAQLVMPLQLDNGQVVLVNRGFVPDNAAVMPDAPGPVTISGVVRLPETGKASRFTPDNDPAHGVWVWVDLPAMGHEIGIGNLAPVMVYQDRVTDSDAYPIGGQLPLPLSNRHQQYAITWYCLALSFIGVWIMASTPKNQAPKDKPAVETEDTIDPVKRRGLYPEATD